MILTDCKICGSTDHEVVLDVSNEKDTYLDYLNIDYATFPRKYLKCFNCGLIYRNFILSNSEKKLLYEHFRDTGLRGETKNEYFTRITSLPEEESENFEKCQFLDDITSNAKVKSILDIGCGAGVFLYSFKRLHQKWECYGVEPTKDFSDIAKNSGITIVNQYLNHYTFDRKFGLITLNHVLEHVDNYNILLSMIMEYIDDEGFVYIEVPSDKDIDFLSPSHDRFMCQHDVIFSEESLSKIILDVGFKIIYSTSFLSIRGRNNIRFLLKKNT